MRTFSSVDELRVKALLPRQAPLVERLHERIRVELLDVLDAGALPGAIHDEHRADHGRHARRVGDGL